MNPQKPTDLNQSLDRLLRSAAAAPRAAEASMPYAVEARVLSAWRHRGDSTLASAEFAAGLRLLRYGLGLACAVALVTVSVTWSGTQNEADDIYAISNATANLALLR